ncbi:hypothetical protein [Agrobacterium fabrum]|uniref:hypothetical protein n=1 Tax=Agrobacterium fabrum TaxID=1176649 RepID=UPI003B9E544F
MKFALPFLGAIHALAIIALSVSSIQSVAAEDGNENEKYLVTRNDLGIVAYCRGKGLLPADSVTSFRAFMNSLFGELPASANADLPEKKGRESIYYL